MFVSELTADADYFLVNKDFASLKFDGESVVYMFQLYGRLIQAMMDGADELKISIIKKTNPRLKYFVGTSMEDVEISNLGFVENTKEQLRTALENATLGEVTYSISDFLSDQLVSDIGSKKATLENYKKYLPRIEQLETFTRVRKTPPTPLEPDIQSFENLSNELFNKFSIYPGRVSEITFPSENVSEESDGLSFGVKTNSDKKLLENSTFNDYYESYYLKKLKTRVYRRFRRRRAEYQRFIANIKFDLSEYSTVKLSSYSNLSVRVALIKDGIEIGVDTFGFNNEMIYEEATAGATKIDARLLVYDPKAVLPDEIYVTNRERYPVEATVFQFWTQNGEIRRRQAAIFVVAPGETVTAYSNKIFYYASESRSYAVTANKYIPGVAGVSNVIKILNPPQASSPPPRHQNFEINVEPGGKYNIAKIMVSGLDSSEYTALIYKKTIGESADKELIGTAFMGKNAITDENIQLGDIILYTAELQFNGAGQNAVASSGFVCTQYGNTSRLSFSIQDQKTRGSGANITHTFKIVESVSTTPASDLLTSVNESGQAGLFEDELSETKTDTTMITNYHIFRVMKYKSSVSYLGTYSAGKVLRFPIRGFLRTRLTYDYIVLPVATSTSGLSYRTVSEETDVNSGNTFKFLYKKFRDFNFPRSVLLPSYSEVIKNDIANALLNLPPGSSEKTTFSNIQRPGKISNLRAVSKEGMDCTFLSWNYSGNKNIVLHFVIFASYNGWKAPIGISIPDRSRNVDIISYCDEKLGGFSGEVIYSVMPVLAGGEKGRETRGVKVHSTKNYPRKALR